ncbi:MAG: PAS domain-containing protein [Alphaproteobacteria bacterium]|nr:PAS domain-containing protein [Alphaproteobacteria bacterium]
MYQPDPDFEPFMALWRNLPRTHHPVLPRRKDINPVLFGAYLPLIGIAEMVAPFHMQVIYAGSGYERSASFEVNGKNYYDLLPPDFAKPMAIFHEHILGTPCGAYIGDVITTSKGNQYLHESLQLPLCSDQGDVRYLMAFGVGRKQLDDASSRTAGDHNAGNIKEMHYVDLGAGTPKARIENFVFHRD